MLRLIMAKFLLACAKVLATADNGERKVTVSGHSIDFTFSRPQSTDSQVWDNEQYSNGAIFIKGYTNSVKLDTDNIKDGKPKLMPSPKYLQHMRNHVFEQALFAEKLDFDKIYYLIMASIGVSIITLVVVVSVVTG